MAYALQRTEQLDDSFSSSVTSKHHQMAAGYHFAERHEMDRSSLSCYFICNLATVPQMFCASDRPEPTMFRCDDEHSHFFLISQKKKQTKQNKEHKINKITLSIPSLTL